ncbi:MAG: hypothetical protein K6E38_05615, partial [Fretibacterium sp.]|nr:hypothetical protein [Fretibacterium sp.]
MKRLNYFRIFSERKSNCILLSLYLSFIIICQIIVNNNFDRFYVGSGSWMIISFLFSPIIIHFFSKLEIDDTRLFQQKSGRKVSLILYGVPLAVLLIYFVAYYPGGFTQDSIEQYGQAIGAQPFNDWHPVLQTLFAFWLPLTITGGCAGSVSLFQVLVFSAALGYCFHTIYQYAGKNYVSGSMIYILCNPLLCISVIPWKDVSFAIGALLLMVFSLKIIMSGGNWLNRFSHFVFLVTVFVFTTIFRHNAILFTAPLLLALFFQIPGKKFLTVLLAIIALFSAVKGPLYSTLRVETPGRRQVETLGLPMTVIGAAVRYTPYALDEDILEFAYKIAPREIWERHYKSGDFNAVKLRPESDTDIIEEYGAKSVLRMMFRCIKSSPGVCLSSLVKLTEGVYTVTDPHPVNIGPHIEKNGYGIEHSSTVYGIEK